MVGDDQAWIKEAGKIAVDRFGCSIFSKTLFHIPTGGSHDQSTFNHENFETKCAGEASFSLRPHALPCSVSSDCCAFAHVQENCMSLILHLCTPACELRAC